MIEIDNQKENLSPFFEPNSIAIIGSLTKFWFGGQVLMNNLLKYGYSGKIYLINPSYDEAQGIKVYPTIKDVPETVDLAIIITAARQVPLIVKDCAEKGVKGIIIGADGFAERDREGTELQDKVVEIARQTGIRILGPNTLGTVNTKTGLETSPYPIGSKVRRGNISLSAQTGLIGPQGFPYKDWGYGISKICDFGNKCDVDESDLLEYLVDDPDTKVIAMEIEGIKNGHRFLNISKRVAHEKPILVFKPGRSKETAKALMSHTGSMAGDQKIYESAFKQTGIIQVDSFIELLDFANAFSCQPLPKGNRLGVITLTGAGGIMATDAAIESGLILAEFSTKTNENLFEIHPTIVGNPSDLGPAGAVMGNLPYKEVIEAVVNDENVDCSLCTLWSLLPSEFYISILDEVKKPKNKPITFWVYGENLETINQICFELNSNGYPAYKNVETAIRALGAMYRYSKIKASK